MKVVLVREGDKFRSESGGLPEDMPGRIVVETETDGSNLPVAEIWEPMFPPGSAQIMEAFIAKNRRAK